MSYQHIVRQTFSVFSGISGWQSIAKIHLCTLGRGEVIPKGIKERTPPNQGMVMTMTQWPSFRVETFFWKKTLLLESGSPPAARQTFPWIRRTQRWLSWENGRGLGWIHDTLRGAVPSLILGCFFLVGLNFYSYRYSKDFIGRWIWILVWCLKFLDWIMIHLSVGIFPVTHRGFSAHIGDGSRWCQRPWCEQHPWGLH